MKTTTNRKTSLNNITYYSITTIAVASVAHDNWMRTYVQDNKRIQAHSSAFKTTSAFRIPNANRIHPASGQPKPKPKSKRRLDKNRDHDRNDEKRRPKSHQKRKNLASETKKISHPKSRFQTKTGTRAERRQSSYGPCERKNKKKRKNATNR